MSLSRAFFIIFLSLALSGCYTSSDDLSTKKLLTIKVMNAPNERTVKRLEQLILNEAPDGFTAVNIISDESMLGYSKNLQQYFKNTYGINARMQVDSSAIGLYVQLERHNGANCYTYALEDYNWYKSTGREMSEYNESELCATNINDKLTQV